MGSTHSIKAQPHQPIPKELENLDQALRNASTIPDNETLPAPKQRFPWSMPSPGESAEYYFALHFAAFGLATAFALARVLPLATIVASLAATLSLTVILAFTGVLALLGIQ